MVQCSWIYDYLCNRCLSPLLMLWVRIPFMARCTRYNIIICDNVSQLHVHWYLRQVVFLQLLDFPPPIKLTATILLKVTFKPLPPCWRVLVQSCEIKVFAPAPIKLADIWIFLKVVLNNLNSSLQNPRRIKKLKWHKNIINLNPHNTQ